MFRLIWLYIRVGVMNEVQYRINFFVQLLESGIALATGLIVLSIIFSYTPSLNQWSQPELLVVMGVHILIGGIINTFIEPNMVRLMDDIAEGTLDYILTKPEDAQLLVSIRELRFWNLVDVLLGGIVMGWGISGLVGSLTFTGLLSFLLMLPLGIILLYCFWLMIASLAFWFVRFSDVATIFETMYQAGRWPITIYPGWLRGVLTFLVPVAFAVTIPAESLTNRLDGNTIGMALGLTAVLVVVSRLIWLWGVRSYAGASA